MSFINIMVILIFGVLITALFVLLCEAQKGYDYLLAVKIRPLREQVNSIEITQSR